jgi:hypothetical protein
MRRLLIGLVAALTTAIVPVMALAGNQEVADQIAKSLRNSGRLSNYKINVKFQDGTASLRGYVASQEQMNSALKVVYQTPGVTRVVNEIAVNSDVSTKTQVASTQSDNPLRERDTESARVDRVPSSYSNTPAKTVSAEEVVDEPQYVTPQRAKPMSVSPRAAERLAMQQGNAREPAVSNGAPLPMYTSATSAVAPVRYDQPSMPNYAWPSYAAYPNYAAVTYPKQYSPTAWPYIGPFYPYPQVPMGWRKVTLEWSDGWWFLDFKDQPASCWHR